MRVYELARERGVPSRELIATLHELGFDRPTTASSSVPAEALDALRPVAREVVDVTVTTDTSEVSFELDDPTPSDAASTGGDEPESGPGVAIPDPAQRGLPRQLGRWAAMVAIWVVVGLGAGLVAAITLPIIQGNRSLTVLSGSMEPEISTGDVVVVEQIAPLDARIGDIVSFRDPDDPSRLITHRVRAMEVAQNEVEFVTKGDANTSVEQWRITPDGQIGRVVSHVPKIGYVLFYLRGSLGRLLLIVLPALLLGAYELWRIWRPETDDTAGEHRTEAA